jgi:translocator protein
MREQMTKDQWFKLIISLGLPNAVGMVASFVTMPAVRSWYADLAKPNYTPPNWIFAPAWLVLYTMMGFAFFLIWTRAGDRRVVFACWFYIVHLLVNGLWPFLFFGLHSPFWAFVDIVLLWFMIIGVFLLFFSIDRKAACLLIPYWLWVTFAASRNYLIWRMN